MACSGRSEPTANHPFLLIQALVSLIFKLNGLGACHSSERRHVMHITLIEIIIGIRELRGGKVFRKCYYVRDLTHLI